MYDVEVFTFSANQGKSFSASTCYLVAHRDGLKIMNSFSSRPGFITSVDESKVVSYVNFIGSYTLPLGWSLGASYSGTDFLSCQIIQQDRQMRAQVDCWTTRAIYSCTYNSKADTTT